MYNLPHLDYEPGFERLLNKNINELLDSLNKPDTIDKINNFAIKYNMNPLYVKHKIIDDYSFGLRFAKDPAKQNYYEDTAVSFIKTFPLIRNAKKLPPSGAKSIVLVSGSPLERGALNSKTTSKSIDFYWEYSYGGKTLKFYATHKFTKDGGGGQNLQLEDIEKFFHNAKTCTNENMIFIAILDGDYYNKKHPVKYNGGNAIEAFNKLLPKDRFYATNINDLLYYISIEIKRWSVANNLDNYTDISIIDEIIDTYQQTKKHDS